MCTYTHCGRRIFSCVCLRVSVRVKKRLRFLRCVSGALCTHAGLYVNQHSAASTHTHSLYLVSHSQQVVSHLVQVGGLACVDEAHHLFEDIWLHVIYLHTVLGGRRGRGGGNNTRRVSRNKRQREGKDRYFDSRSKPQIARVTFTTRIFKSSPELNSLTLLSAHKHTGTVRREGDTKQVPSDKKKIEKTLEPPEQSKHVAAKLQTTLW